MERTIKKYLSESFEFIGIDINNGVYEIKGKQIIPKKYRCQECGGKHVKFKHSSKVREYKESPLILNGPTILKAIRAIGMCKDCKSKFLVPSSLIHNKQMTISEKQWIDFLLQNPYKMTDEEIAEEAYVNLKTIKKAKREI